MIRAQFNISSFLQNGALLRTAPDQFNLITGPFTQLSLQPDSLKADFPVVYQPFFWDFLQTDRKILFASQGVSSHFFTRQELVQLLTEHQPLRPTLEWQSLDTEAFKDQFKWSQQEFASNRLQKTVPIVCERSSSKLNSHNLAWMLSHLFSEDLPGWTYGFWEDGTGYLGQTPELISEWSAETQILKTAAVAGTLKNSAENELLIQQDAKIRNEHEFVVEDISTQLKKSVSDSKIFKKATRVQKLKHLLHLKTDFECHDIDLSEALAVMQHLHPTAALGIYPRHESEMQIFSKLDLQKERLNFAAPFAFIQKDKILCVAGIRNLIFSNHQLSVFSGCGVTAASDFESELVELQLKRDSVKKMMGLFE